MFCGIYIRKSREKKNQREAYRLTYQREVLPAYAKSRGWEYEIYDDGFMSGADMANLPQLNRLISDIKEGRINVVLTIEFSRLSRDESLRQFVYFLDICAQYEVAIATETAFRRPWIPMEWQMCILEGSFSAVEMKMTRQRMAEGTRRAMLRGKWLSVPPYGYRIDKNDGHLYLHPEEGPILKKILQMAQEHSTRVIEASLIHVRGPRGGTFTMSRIRRLISDKRLLFYAGYRQYEGKLIRGDWDAIITLDTMRRIQEHKKSLNKRGRREGTEPAYLLTGLGIFKCAYCHHSIKSHVSTKYYPKENRQYRLLLYGCKSIDCRFHNKFFRMEIINKKIIDNIKEVLSRTDVIERGFRALQIDEKENPELLRLKDQLEKKFIAKNNLISAIEKGILSEDEIADRMKKIRSDINKIERKIATITAKEEEESGVQISFEYIRKIKNTVLAHLDEMPMKNIRELIKDLIQEIRLYHKYMIILYKFPINEKGGYQVRIHLIRK